MQDVSHQQLDDIEDAIDIADTINASAIIYKPLAEASGTAGCADDVLAKLTCDRHPNESVALFRENPVAFLKSEKLVDIGPVSAATFAVIISALDAVASAGHALDDLAQR